MIRPSIFGVDPGLGGGLAFMNDDGLRVWPMPVLLIHSSNKDRREIDVSALADIMRDHAPDRVVIELVTPMPGIAKDGQRTQTMGATSAFRFGESAMAPRAVAAALGLPWARVTPRKWQADLGVPKGADAHRFMASRFFPKCSFLWPRAMDGGLAAAALIALWGSREVGLDRAGILPARDGELALAD